MHAARALVDRHYPEAVVAVLAGSSARGQLTPTSDLDVVLVLPGRACSFRRTLRHEGRLAEVFAYTPDELRRWWDVDAATSRCTLVHMCASGVLLRGERDGGPAMQQQARVFLAAGPPPAGDDELAARRYRLTASVDDLRDATDAGEWQVLAAEVLLEAAQLHLLVRRQWLGSGKWLLRRLRDADPDLAQRLVQAHRHAVCAVQVQPLVQVVEEVLRGGGGSLAEGYGAG
ncbi:nucleotidyltransferase domain-containing protein [Kineococcus arenarius]|uniref:nucleotidyltransferase domain-containing protein n=1 Tax=unclassified Kineococcus TaxID=2621656 RepID=UPI003D7D332F